MFGISLHGLDNSRACFSIWIEILESPFIWCTFIAYDEFFLIDMKVKFWCNFLRLYQEFVTRKTSVFPTRIPTEEFIVRFAFATKMDLTFRSELWSDNYLDDIGNLSTIMFGILPEFQSGKQMAYDLFPIEMKVKFWCNFCVLYQELVIRKTSHWHYCIIVAANITEA